MIKKKTLITNDKCLQMFEIKKQNRNLYFQTVAKNFY